MKLRRRKLGRKHIFSYKKLLQMGLLDTQENKNLYTINTTEADLELLIRLPDEPRKDIK